MARKSVSGTGNRQLPQQHMRNRDGHQVCDSEKKHANRMSKINRGERDPDLDEEEFEENLKEFFPDPD